MCPDAELLSAWTDAEVPVPWADRISSHVAACPSCSKKVEAWRALSQRLHSAGTMDEAAMVARIRDRLDEDLRAPGKVPPRPSRSLRPSTRGPAKPLTLPLPLAAAAALALFFVGGLVGGYSGGFFSTAASNSLARSAVPATGSTRASNSASPSMDALVRYLEAQNAQVSVTIQLPQSAVFSSTGEPMIVRTPPVQTVAWPPGGSGSGFEMNGPGK